MTDCQRLTIAVALSALRFKSAEQTATSYVLDLQNKFTTTDGIVIPAATDRQWMSIALDLERQLEDLRCKHDRVRIELLSLRAGAAAGSDPLPLPNLPKKKGRKRTEVPQELSRLDLNVEAVAAGLPAAPLPALTAFTALHSLQTMLEPSGSKSPPISLLVRTMRRALELAGTALRETLSAAPPAPDWPHVFKTITMLATYLINTALPVLVAKTQKRKKTLPTIDVTVADFFGLLATSIFIPLIRSFVPLSLTWMVRLFSAEKEGKLYALTDDIRPNCLSLLRTCIATLNEQTELPVLGSLQHVKERIILETMRELEQLRLQATGETTCCDQASAEILAKGLARKDILWYLVNVLHVTLSPGCQTSSPRSPPDGFDYTSPRTEILRDALLTLLTNLLSGFAGKSDGNREPEPGTAGSTNAYSMRKIDLRLCRKELYADDIGEGMLLAAVERCLAHIRAVA